MGYWLLVASSRQHTCSCILSHAEIFGETSNLPSDSAPLQPRFGAPWLLAFPKTKITFEREEISDRRWDSGKHDRAADGDWENCVRSQGAYFEGEWGVIVLCTMFLVSSSMNASIFHITWLDTFWTGLIFLCLFVIWLFVGFYSLKISLSLDGFFCCCLSMCFRWKPLRDAVKCKVCTFGNMLFIDTKF